MAVTVFSTQAKASGHKYDDASSVTVNSGHLMVISDTRDSGVVAIYSPGNWHHADTDAKAS